MRELGILFGTTVYAAATTTTAFFLGLGTGSAFFGERLKLSKSPLRTYGFLELAVAISALLFFGLLAAYRALYPGLVTAFDGHSSALLVMKLLLGVIILFPPAFCMGGTLPVVSRFLTGRFGGAALGRKVPIFYGINTFGAASGALAAGFYLPRWIGMSGSYWLATGVMVFVGVMSLVLSRLHRPEALTTPASRQGETSLKISIPHWIAGLAFFSGFSTLALQVLWVRMFAQTLHNSVYTYSAIIVTFLIALAVGAWISSWLAKRFPDHTRSVLTWMLFLAGVLTLASPNLFYYFGSDQGAYLGSSENWPEYLKLVFSATGVAIFPATVALGMIFPFLLKLSEPFVEGDAGRVVGKLAAINTSGAVLGSLASGFLLLDLFGLWPGIRLLGVSYLLFLFVLAPLMEAREKGENGWFSKSSTAKISAAVALIIFLTWLDPARLDVVYHSPVKRKESIIKVKEGSDATVAVIRKDDDLRIKVNNFYVLGSTNAQEHERLQSQLPLLIHPEPKKVFVVGLGTGITAGGTLDVDGVEEVTVSELLPSVVDAAREFFGSWINGLFEDERVEVIAEDGRNYLAVTREKFDVIVADLFVPWRNGVGGLYTREHYARSLERLEPGGIYAQWLPLYQLTEAEFASIANTMRQVFPQITVWRGDFFADGSIVCLVGHRDPLPLDWSSFNQRSYEHNRKLGIDQVAPLKYVAGHLKYYAGNLTSTDFYTDARVNTDDFPHIEFEAPISHRAEKAGEVSWFGGEALMSFFDSLQEKAPFDEDPWLENVPGFSKSIAQIGHLMHELKVAQENKDREVMEQNSAELKQLMGKLSAIYGR